MSLTQRLVKGSPLTTAEMDANLREIGAVSADIASAATTDLATATGNIARVTGTTGITSFGTAAPIGTTRVLLFAGALTITHSTGTPGILCPGGASFKTKAGDMLEVYHVGAGVWRSIGYLSADGRVIASALLSFLPVYDNGSTPGATPTIDCNNGARQKITLSASVTTLTLVAPPGPGTTQIDIYQPASGGPWLWTPPTALKWPVSYGSPDKALSTAASARDRLVIDYDGSVWVANLMKGIA